MQKKSQNNNKLKIDSFLSPILERPAMYCVNNVEDIYLIILGYSMGIKDDEFNDFMIGFRDFVNEHFESNNDAHWSRLIRFYSASDIHSIELFGKLYNDFIINTNNL